MASSPIVTRGFLFSVSLIVTDGYGDVPVATATPEVHDPLTTKDLSFIWQGPRKTKKREFEFIASGKLRFARNLSAQAEFYSQEADDEEVLALYCGALK